MRIDAGVQPMAGRTAVMYMRSRHGRSDWDRQLRQHDVLRSIHHKVRTLSALAMFQVMLAVGEHIDTDMNHRQALSLGRKLVTIDPSQVRFIRFSREMAQGTRLDDGRSFLVPNNESIRERVQATLADTRTKKPSRRRCKDRNVALE